MQSEWPRDADLLHFDEHGWVLVPDALPSDALVAARDALFRVVPTPEAVAAGGDAPEVARYRQAKEQWSREVRDASRADERSGEQARHAFAPEQYLGLREFPTAELALDVVPFHPRLIALAERALGTPELRLYQAETFAKYEGVTDYEQPLHIDYTNHALLPPRPGARPTQIQIFLYLSDVAPGSGPPRIVSRRHTAGTPLMDLAFHRAGSEGVRWHDHEVAAVGPAGSALVYASDVAHRGSAITTKGAGRFTFNLAYRRADSDWAGGSPFARKGTQRGWREVIEALGPRQLALLGFPLPGDAYWTPATLAGAAERYPALDLTPWRRARHGSQEVDPG